MNAQPLHRVLEALSHSRSMVPDPGDREAARRVADAIRKLDPTPLVVVAGSDTDPVVETVEWVEDAIDRCRDALSEVDGHVDDLLRVMRQRRNSPLAEIVRTILACVAGEPEPTVTIPPTDVLALRKALAAWDHGLNIANPAPPVDRPEGEQ